MEQWKAIPGFEGAYEVSDRGNVRSLDRMVNIGGGHQRICRGRILCPYLRAPGGYPTVHLHYGGHSKYLNRSIHRLVLEAFVGPCPEGMECLHADDDPLNNHLSNLRWGTRSENRSDGLRNGRNANARKTHCKRNHEFTPESTYINPCSGGRQCRPCMRDFTCNKKQKRLTLA